MIDLHCHLDLYPDPHSVVHECHTRGTYVLSVTTTPSAWEGTHALAKQAPRIRTALGLHPQIAHLRKAELPLFEKLLPKVRYVGEIGLDGGPEYKQFWQDQELVFNRILDLCVQEGGRIMTLHSRRAATPVLDALEARSQAGTPILHWFSGSQRELSRAIEMGCWFSVGPAMLETNKGRQLVAKMPRDRVLTETDGPFAQTEGRPLLPWETARASAVLASVWNHSQDAVEQQLRQNLRTLTGKSGLPLDGT
ncbi:MAG TPA: hydrolase TatD [Oxalobacteraceae bacterium]|nr:hydrolase TatD [Oxalobacteraceae bacterium]